MKGIRPRLPPQRARAGSRNLSGGAAQRRMQIRLFVTFRTVAHAELDAEIDTEADEEDEECYRNQVERAYHEEPQRGRDRQAHHQAEEYRSDDLPGAEREPENDQYTNHGGESVANGALLDDGELVVVHRRLTGKIDGRTEPCPEMQVCGCLPNPRGRACARLQRAEI